MPQLVVYLSQQFAILIVPVNLILLFAVSWLVGLNAAIATYAYKHRSSSVVNHWMGGVGALVALFTACPTCAGFFLLTMIGLAGAVTVALTLSSLQSMFIAIGLPLLVIAPIVTARRIPKNWMISCSPAGEAKSCDKILGGDIFPSTLKKNPLRISLCAENVRHGNPSSAREPTHSRKKEMREERLLHVT